MKRSKQLLIVTVAILLIVITYRGINEYRKDKALKNSKSTIGILSEIHTPKGVRDLNYGIIQYRVNGIQYETKSFKNYSILKLGDTVQIEYAIRDNSIARVVDKYYMKKYKYLKKD